MDKESGDGYHFDNNTNTKGAATGIRETSSDLKQVSKDLSKEVLGSERYMTTGYAYDINSSYNAKTIAHAGIDYAAGPGTNVFVVVPGRIVNIANYGSTGQFVTIEANDGNRWIYGHISTSRKVGDTLKSQDSVGKVFSQGNNTHFHIEVQNTPFDDSIKGGIPYQSRGVLAFVLEKTISPLQAYWMWRNR